MHCAPGHTTTVWPTALLLALPSKNVIHKYDGHGQGWNQETLVMCLQRGHMRTEFLKAVNEKVEKKHLELRETMDSASFTKMNRALLECVKSCAHSLGASALYTEQRPAWTTDAAKK